MSDEGPPPIEIVDLEESVASVSREADLAHVHSWLRTIAVVAAALSLVWIGASAAGIRTANERQTCFSELQMAMFSPGPAQPQQEIGDRFARKAEECGFPILADSIRQSYERE